MLPAPGWCLFDDERSYDSLRRGRGPLVHGRDRRPRLRPARRALHLRRSVGHIQVQDARSQPGCRQLQSLPLSLRQVQGGRLLVWRMPHLQESPRLHRADLHGQRPGPAGHPPLLRPHHLHARPDLEQTLATGPVWHSLPRRQLQRRGADLGPRRAARLGRAVHGLPHEPGQRADGRHDRLDHVRGHHLGHRRLCTSRTPHAATVLHLVHYPPQGRRGSPGPLCQESALHEDWQEGLHRLGRPPGPGHFVRHRARQD
mmetsp:Transcript_78845/g.198115  ORF Transcript_78845/g.198115 Transcript_78845/m.198115 type:complete len:257 (-) Transcript_78845:1200-1970(-)